MDKQLEFFVRWQAVCEPLVEYFVETQDEYGKEVAIRMWTDKNNAYVAKAYPVGKTTLGEDLAKDIFLAACIYVDLLIRWGCFDGDTFN